MQGQDEVEGKVLGQRQGHGNEGLYESQVHLRVRARFRVKFSVRLSEKVCTRDIVRNRVGSG